MDYSELKRDLYFGIATLAFGVLYTLSCFTTVTAHGSAAISGRTFPLIVAAIILILGICQVNGTVRKLKRFPPTATRRYYPLFECKQILSMATYMGALSLYILGIEYLGFIVSTVVIVLFLLKFSLAKSKIATIAVIFILPGLLYWVFVVLMEVQLPITPLP